MDTFPDLRLRPDLLAQGYTDAELLRLRRSGALATIRGGAYIPAGDPRLGCVEDAHALLVRATVGRLAPGAVVSHVSAAVLHGLPVWGVPLGRVHVTRVGSSGGRISGRLHLHVLPVADDEIVEIDGIRVTSLQRTLVDLARSVGFEQAKLGVVGEFDGRVKYGKYLRPGQSPGDAVFAEKVREDAIRGTGLWVVRWIWADLDAFAPVAALLRTRFASR